MSIIIETYEGDLINTDHIIRARPLSWGDNGKEYRFELTNGESNICTLTKSTASRLTNEREATRDLFDPVS